MAPSVRDSRESGTGAGTAATHSVAIPTCQVGDDLWASFTLNGGYGTATDPAGWTRVFPTTVTDDGFMTLLVYRKTATSAEVAGGNVSVTVATAVRGNAGAVSVANADTGPLDGSTSSSGTGTSTTATSLATTVANTLMLSIVALDSGAEIATPPSGLTERWNPVKNGITGQANAGATMINAGTASASYNWSWSTSLAWKTWVGAIKPLTPAGSTVTLTPAVATMTASAVSAVPGAVSVALTPAAVTLAPVALTAGSGVINMTLSPASMSVIAPAIDASSAAIEINLVPAQATITVGSVSATLVPSSEITLTPAEIHLLPTSPIFYIETPGVDLMTIAFATVTGVGEYIRGELASTEGGVPQRFALVVPGSIAWDNCECGQFAQSITSVVSSRVFPTPAADVPTEPCGHPLAVVSVTMSLLRCVPSVDDRGTSPSVEALLSAARVIEDDRLALRRGLADYLHQLQMNYKIMNYTIGAAQSVGPEGMCGGIEINYTFGINNDAMTCG